MNAARPEFASVAEPAEPPKTPGRPSLGYLLFRSLRPRQWTKNGVILAPLLFARLAGDLGAAGRAAMAVLAFCLLSGGVYLVNDWLDRERDRLHPEKRLRPIAAGHLGGMAVALLLAACWLGAGLLGWVLGIRFATVAAGYVGLQLFYSLLLKRQVILDVVVIAIGFVLRVAAGGVAVGVGVSNWLFLCTLLLAVFLGFAKRRHELSSLQGDAAAHRANLSEYSVPLLDQMLSIVASSCILAYGLYTVSQDTVAHVGSDGLKFTVPFVIYGILRYLYLIHRRNLGGSPERVLLSDRPIILSVMAFVGVSAWVLYF